MKKNKYEEEKIKENYGKTSRKILEIIKESEREEKDEKDENENER